MTLEAATANAEDAARSLLVISPIVGIAPADAYLATAQEINDAFRVLEEASSDTRRMLRRVLAHPVYGLGPGEDSLSYDLRQELALNGGLSKRHLRLL
jgi:hypothetical protein